MKPMKPSDNAEVGPGAVASIPTKRSPLRTCVGCQQSDRQGHRLRLVCGPTGQLLVDAHGKLPGRGAYVCLRRSCVDRALKGTRLREALRQDVVSAPLDELVLKLVSALEARAIACIHMARKAGRAVSGYSRVMRALAYEPVAFLLMAEDTAPERLREYMRHCVRRQIPSHRFLMKTQLGALVGRDESSAIGILDARLSERLRFYLEGMRQLTER